MHPACASAVALGLLLAAPASAQTRWTAPEGIDWRTGTIHSERTRLAAEIFSLESNSGKKLPCILMAHGWGGTVRGLRRDWLNAMHWLQSEPMCDTARIGVWGSRYSGGHVLYVAARDKRVKAVFSQVGGVDSRFVVASEQAAAWTLNEAKRRARGALAYPEPGAVEVDALRGAPIRDKLMHYAPVELAE